MGDYIIKAMNKLTEIEYQGIVWRITRELHDCFFVERRVSVAVSQEPGGKVTGFEIFGQSKIIYKKDYIESIRPK